jgi:nucleoid-associated protein EbfC
MSKNPFGNMGNIMRQAQAMQDQLARVQEQAAIKIAEG